MCNDPWETLKQKESFIEDVETVLKGLTLGEEDWEIVNILVDVMPVEFDVQKQLDGSYVVYPMFLGDTLTDLEPLIIPATIH